MGAVLIGVDPAKRSNTIEVINASEKTVATGRFDNSTTGYREMRALVMQLIASGAPKALSVAQARALVATVRPRDAVGKARRQLAVDLIDDVVVLDRKIKAMEARRSEAVTATGDAPDRDRRDRRGHRGDHHR